MNQDVEAGRNGEPMEHERFEVKTQTFTFAFLQSQNSALRRRRVGDTRATQHTRLMSRASKSSRYMLLWLCTHASAVKTDSSEQTSTDRAQASSHIHFVLAYTTLSPLPSSRRQSR